MANTVKGTIGDDDVELNNAATESTLSALLSVAKVDSKILMELAKQAKVDGKVLEKLQKEHDASQGGANNAGSSLKEVAKSGSLVGGVLSDLTQSIGATIGNMANFAGMLLDGTANGEKFFQVFKDLPLGIGLFAQALAFAQRRQQENLDIYTGISKSGAGLIGSFNAQRVQAMELYLTQDEYIAAMSEASGVINNLTGDNKKGGDALLAINRALVTSNMPNNLRSLGYTYQEINTMLPTYLKLTGDGIKKNKDYQSEIDRLTAASQTYGETVDFLARVTGKSRDQVMKEQRQAMEEVNLQALLSRKYSDAKESINLMLNTMKEFGGDGSFKDATAQLAGFAGSADENAQTMYQLQPNLYALQKEMLDLGKANKFTKDKQIEYSAKILEAQKKDYERAYLMGDAAVASWQKTTSQYNKMSEMYAMLKNSDEKSAREFIEKRMKEAKASSDAAEAAKANEQKWKDFSSMLNRLLLPVVEKLTDLGNKLADRFIKLAGDEGVMKRFEEAADSIIDWISMAFDHPDRAWAQIKGWFQDMLSKFFKYFSESRLGRYLFGDLGKELEDDSKINKMKGVDQELYKAMWEKNKEGKLNPAEKEEFERLGKIMSEGRQSLANDFDRAAKQLEDTSRGDLLRKAYEKYAQENKVSVDEAIKRWNWDATESAKIEDIVDKIKSDNLEEAKRIREEARQIQSGKDKRIDITPQKFAGGTLSNGKLVRDFGTASLAELHNKEAVLTEEQLTNLAKGAYNTGASQGNGSSSIGQMLGNMFESSDMKIMAEALISLNKQATVQTKYMEQVAEYQRRLLERTRGNKFLG